MATIRDVVVALEAIAPSALAFDYDRIGLQIGDEGREVRRVLVTLDRSAAAVELAGETACDLIVSHHPFIWEPLARAVASDSTGRLLLTLAERGIGLIAVHTNWDCAPDGLNDALAARLGLSETRPFGAASRPPMILAIVYVPDDAVEGMIDALSAAGAGRIGTYERCAYSSGGEGTFRPLAGSNPTVGTIGRVETAPERRIEMVAPAARQGEVEAAIRRAHPYETPAFQLVAYAGSGYPAGRLGLLDEPMRLGEFLEFVDDRLATRSLAWGDPDRPIRRVGVVGGAADGEWRSAAQERADVFLTGEVRQHVAVDATDAGFAVVAAGHYATEQPGMRRLAERLRESLPEIEWIVHEPAPGRGGRPV
jgi:dinuclear metal center YbgI/SA1388 family protein